MSISQVEYKPPTVSWPADESAPNYYDHTETFPFLGPALLPHFDSIVEEMKVFLLLLLLLLCVCVCVCGARDCEDCAGAIEFVFPARLCSHGG
jgi:hypothetical protein